MVESMLCDICGSETQIRYGIDLRQSVWCCSKCFRIYRSIHEHYSKKGYSNERCIDILKGVVEKQKQIGKWT